MLLPTSQETARQTLVAREPWVTHPSLPAPLEGALPLEGPQAKGWKMALLRSKRAPARRCQPQVAALHQGHLQGVRSYGVWLVLSGGPRVPKPRQMPAHHT